MAPDNCRFQSGVLDFLAMQTDSSHATCSVCSSAKGIYAHEVVKVRGSGCETSLSTQVAGAFCSLCIEWNVYTHTPIHSGGVLFLL